MNVYESMIKIANRLDEIGLYKQADKIDRFSKRFPFEKFCDQKYTNEIKTLASVCIGMISTLDGFSDKNMEDVYKTLAGYVDEIEEIDKRNKINA